ncbi:MAG: hypothetical protein K5876_03800 [Ruminiclostridium sp.]|nr:hypothetical protein [Ruminiclostridium sp.]
MKKLLRKLTAVFTAAALLFCGPFFSPDLSLTPMVSAIASESVKSSFKNAEGWHVLKRKAISYDAIYSGYFYFKLPIYHAGDIQFTTDSKWNVSSASTFSLYDSNYKSLASGNLKGLLSNSIKVKKSTYYLKIKIAKNEYVRNMTYVLSAEKGSHVQKKTTATAGKTYSVSKMFDGFGEYSPTMFSMDKSIVEVVSSYKFKALKAGKADLLGFYTNGDTFRLTVTVAAASSSSSSKNTDDSKSEETAASGKVGIGSTVYVTAISGSKSWYGGDVKDNLFYGGTKDKWESKHTSKEKAYVIWKLSKAAPITGYRLYSPFDTYESPSRQTPTAWTVYGSNAASDPSQNSSSWEKLSSVTGAAIAELEVKPKEYIYFIRGGTKKYKYYKFEVDSASFKDPGDKTNSVHLSGFRLFNDTDPFYQRENIEPERIYKYDLSADDYIIITNPYIPNAAIYAYTWDIMEGEGLADYDKLTDNYPTLMVIGKKTGTVRIGAMLQCTDVNVTGKLSNKHYVEFIITIKPAGTVKHTDYRPSPIEKTGVTCPKCGGSGIDKKASMPKFCYRCHGTGKVPK